MFDKWFNRIGVAVTIAASIILVYFGFFPRPPVDPHPVAGAMTYATPWPVWTALATTAALLITVLSRMAFNRSAKAAAPSAPKSDVQISIISPSERGVLVNGEPRPMGRRYPVRIKISHLPEGHKVWILNGDLRSDKFWPQEIAVRNASSGEWEGHTFVWNWDGDVTVFAVIAPPTAHHYFEYYHKAGSQIDRIKQALETQNVTLDPKLFDRIPLVPLPPECKFVAHVSVSNPAANKRTG